MKNYKVVLLAIVITSKLFSSSCPSTISEAQQSLKDRLEKFNLSQENKVFMFFNNNNEARLSHKGRSFLIRCLEKNFQGQDQGYFYNYNEDSLRSWISQLGR